MSDDLFSLDLRHFKLSSLWGEFLESLPHKVAEQKPSAQKERTYQLQLALIYKFFSVSQPVVLSERYLFKTFGRWSN
eukprot:1946563-Amphidinium_carterae.1